MKWISTHKSKLEKTFHNAKKIYNNIDQKEKDKFLYEKIFSEQSLDKVKESLTLFF